MFINENQGLSSQTNSSSSSFSLDEVPEIPLLRCPVSARCCAFSNEVWILSIFLSSLAVVSIFLSTLFIFSLKFCFHYFLSAWSVKDAKRTVFSLNSSDFQGGELSCHNINQCKGIYVCASTEPPMQFQSLNICVFLYSYFFISSFFATIFFYSAIGKNTRATEMLRK